MPIVSTQASRYRVLQAGLLKAGLLLACLLLAACGFRLREDVRLPDNLKTLRLAQVDPYSALARELQAALERAGAQVVEDPALPASVLRVDRLEERRSPLTVDAAGRAQEFEMVLSAEVSLADAAGAYVMSPQTIELRRDYLFDTAQAQGTSNEEELMREELQRELVQAILRRIDSALR